MKCDHPGFGYGLRVLAGSGNDLGLYRLVGTVGRASVQTVR